MNLYNSIFLFILFCFQLTFSQLETKKDSLVLLTKDTVFTSGNFQTLSFYSASKNFPKLYISNSYGTTLSKAKREQKKLLYTIPKNICSKRGLVKWALVEDSKTLLQGEVHIVSDTIVSKIETYVGPPSIMAGNRDFSMIVMIPTDTLDNPIMDNSKILLKKQFLNTEDTTKLAVQNLIGYRRIYATKKTGRYLLSSNAFQKESTEHTLNIWPALPTNFTIKSIRNHEYADGNQLNKISTSIIKDPYGNIISDGTLVHFNITDKHGAILNANGTTINGIASTKLVHPDHHQIWKIKAYIYGISVSNQITLEYKQVINDFQVIFSKHNRKITVGPLQSFMQQMIPDGLRVELDVQKGDKSHKYMIDTSKNGFVTFYLDPENYKDETYDFKITTAAIHKTFKNKRVW